MQAIETSRSARCTRVVLLIVVGLLGLHLPHYLAETASSADYAVDPGPVLVAMMISSGARPSLSAAGAGSAGKIGVWVAVVSWVLSLVQESWRMPGLSETWSAPTRLLSIVLARAIVAIREEAVALTGTAPYLQPRNRRLTTTSDRRTTVRASPPPVRP